MLISNALDHDSHLVTILKVIATETGEWVICEVIEPDHDNDVFRAYPNENASASLGLACLSSSSVSQVIATAKEY